MLDREDFLLYNPGMKLPNFIITTPSRELVRYYHKDAVALQCQYFGTYFIAFDFHAGSRTEIANGSKNEIEAWENAEKQLRRIHPFDRVEIS